jgi:hypothetical protein
MPMPISGRSTFATVPVNVPRGQRAVEPNTGVWGAATAGAWGGALIQTMGGRVGPYTGQVWRRYAVSQNHHSYRLLIT